MRILWLCTQILPTFVEEFGIRRRPFAGWMETLLYAIKEIPNIECGLCFPIIDEGRMKSGECNKCHYYSFHANINDYEYNPRMKQDFKLILKEFCPDIVHIWGTEMNQSLAMMEACQDLGLERNTIIRLQGIPSIWGNSVNYCLGIPEKYLDMKSDGKRSIREEVEWFHERGKIEVRALRITNNICDKSEFGKQFSLQINPHANFYLVDNILRHSFYKYIGRWEIETCCRYRIFVAQAHYPVKGIHFLLQALRIVVHQFPGVELYIAGTNIVELNYRNAGYGYARFLNDLLDEFGLRHCVHFLGERDEDEMVQEYLSAHVVICPSISENKSNSICEAMMIGTPVIASFVDGNVDLIRHNVDGFLYPANAPYMLAGYISKIFSDGHLAKRFSIEEVKTATKRHEKKKIISQMMDIYCRMEAESS